MYIVMRTQIYLSEKEIKALDREVRSTGRKKSQLIREAVDHLYVEGVDPSRVIHAIERSSGAWKRRESGAKYVERLRRGRLARLHRHRG
jgi:predicted DNA-binding protein